MAYTTTDRHEPDMNAAIHVEGVDARPLHGMKAICAYMGKSANTVRKLIKADGLPVGRIGGEWVSDEKRIDDWRFGRIG